MPFMGFITGSIIFATIGIIVLKTVPTFKFNALNLIFFVFGALPVALLFGFIYGEIFADSNNQLTSSTSVLFFLLSILLGGIAGGTAVTLIKNKV